MSQDKKPEQTSPPTAPQAAAQQPESERFFRTPSYGAAALVAIASERGRPVGCRKLA